MNTKTELTFLNLVTKPLAPDEFPDEPLFQWLLLPRVPILFSDDPKTVQLIRATLRGDCIRFVYLGGSTAGKIRKVSPAFLFTFEEARGIYVYGYCHERGANRVFRLDRILSELVLN